jgi:N-ethylmaleimide reductase
METHIGWDSKLKVGSIELSNRVVMSALTRERCPVNGVPTDLVAEYYAQRASAGLIFTETTAWSQRGRSSAGSANLYTLEQAEGWKKVIDAIHQKKGLIFVQINHAGRSTNS